jgi:regulator of RNase E activity RraB
MGLGWEFYATELDGDPIGLLVDLDAANDATSDVRAELPLLCRLHVPMPRPMSSGLTSERDFAALEKLEDSVESAAAEIGGRFVGRISYRREWVFYIFVAVETGALEAFDRSVRRAGLSGAQLEVDPDAEWTHYDAFLHPFPQTMRHILNRRTVEALREAGDDPTSVRPMTHELVFDARDQAEPILLAARERRYATEIESNGGAHRLRITKEIPLDLESIDRTSLALMRLADKHGGRYVGWSCGELAAR